MSDRESRILRDRLATARDGLDRASSGAPPASAARMLVQVFDGGSIPTTGNSCFLGHPAVLNCDEVEGAPCPPVVDTTTTVPFIGLGSNPFVAGDLAILTAAGGRWVSEKGGKPPLGCIWWCCVPSISIDPPASGEPATATLTVAPDGSVASIGLYYPGSNYQKNPRVSIGGGCPAGSGATATAKVGEVLSISLSNRGSGYDPNNPPNVTIAPPGAGGEQATATVTVNRTTGALSSITLTDSGSLYLDDAPMVTIDAPPNPKGVQATARTTAGAGIVTSLTLTNPGSGYPSATLPPYLNVTLACANWSLSFRIYPHKTVPSYIWEVPKCLYLGATTFDFPSMPLTNAIPGVTVSAIGVWQDGVGWEVGFTIDVENDPAQAHQFGACNQYPPGVGPIEDTIYGLKASATTGVTPIQFSSSTLGLCERPYAGSGTIVAYWIGFGGAFHDGSKQICFTELIGPYVILGGGIPNVDPDGPPDPTYTLTMTMSEP